MPRPKAAAPSSLARALAYRNSQILHKFLEQYDVSLEDAADLFTETKRWLWLCAQPDAPRLMITGEMVMVDEMWHTFVLFTREYHRWCTRHFGRYLHHRPTTWREKQAMHRSQERDPAGYQRRRLRALARQYEYVYDRLGPATLVKWYAEYPRRYDQAFFQRALRVPPVPELTSSQRGRLAGLSAGVAGAARG